MHLLGIDIDTLKRTELLGRVERWLSEESGFHRIATVNPEFLLLAREDALFRQSLAAADLRIADGFGIVLAFRFRGARVERFPGADIMEALLEMANTQHLSVFLAVREGGLSTYEEVRSAMLKKYPDMAIGGADIDSRRASIDGNVYGIRDAKYDILISNFGAPEQEIFLESFRAQPGGIRIALVVGGFQKVGREQLYGFDHVVNVTALVGFTNGIIRGIAIHCCFPRQQRKGFEGEAVVVHRLYTALVPRPGFVCFRHLVLPFPTVPLRVRFGCRSRD